MRKNQFSRKPFMPQPRSLQRHTPCYCYGAWQPAYDRMKHHGIRFHQGIPQEQHILSWFPKGGILVLDDLMDECGNDKNILDIFTKYSLHKNVTVIYLLQDIFPVGKYSKTISRNVHYVWAFKNPSDQEGIRNLLVQAFPSNWSTVLETFQKVTEQRHGYLLLDFHPTSPDTQRVLSNVLKDQGITNCWQFDQQHVGRQKRRKALSEHGKKRRKMESQGEASGTNDLVRG